jgi:hypothetical protein
MITKLYRKSKIMKKKLLKNISLLAVSACIGTTSYADNITKSKLAIGANVGTTGFSLEGRTPFTENLYGRIATNYFYYKHSMRKGSLDYKGKLHLLTVPLLVDYHPFPESGFHISAGIAYNDNKVNATATPNKAVRIYNTTYQPAELGTVKAKLTMTNKIAPIVAIGYDSSFIKNKAWSFNAEAGIMYQGKEKIKVSATGYAAQQQSTIDDLNRDANDALKRVKKYLKFFPVISIGFKYNF